MQLNNEVTLLEVHLKNNLVPIIMQNRWCKRHWILAVIQNLHAKCIMITVSVSVFNKLCIYILIIAAYWLTGNHSVWTENWRIQVFVEAIERLGIYIIAWIDRPLHTKTVSYIQRCCKVYSTTIFNAIFKFSEKKVHPMELNI